MENAARGREIKRARELSQDTDGVCRRRLRGLPENHVERFGRNEIQAKKRFDADNARRQRGRDRGVGKLDGDDGFELGGELMNALRRKVQPEKLDRRESIAFGVVRTKDRTQRSRPYLMKDSKRAEAVWGHRASGFCVQLTCSLRP
jgi:hypothetical protein